MAKIKIQESTKQVEVRINVNLLEDEELYLVKDKEPAKIVKMPAKKK